MSNLKRAIIYLSNLGITPGMPRREERSIRLANQISLLSAILTLGYFLLEFLFLKPRVAVTSQFTFYLIQILIVISFSGILVLNYFKKTVLARIAFSIFLPLVFLPNSFLLSKPLRTEFYMYGFAAIIFIFFQKKRWITPLFMVPIIVFLLMIYNLSKTYPDVYVLDAGTFVRIGFSFFIIYFTMTLLLSESDKYEHEIEIKNRSLSIQQSRLQKINTAKDKIFSIVSHDLRSPIGSLLAMLKMLQKSQLSADEFRNHTLAMYNNVEQLHSTLDNLLYWAQTQTEGLKPKPQEINLNILIDKVIQLNAFRAETKGVALKVSGHLDLEVVADLTMIRSVFINLIGNALKFTDTGDTIEIRVERKEHFAEIHISDNGHGMDTVTLNKLFKTTEHVSTRGTKNESGTGLGLLLCKEFIEKNGGTISASSELGKGSDFFFTLLLADS